MFMERVEKMSSTGDPLAALSDYEVLHVIPHLLAIDSADLVDRLLQLETPIGLNALYQAKEARRIAPSYTSDLRLVFRSALLSRDGLVTQCRYALMLASVLSRTLTLPASLVPILLQRDVWSATDAMRFAEAIEDPVRRAETIALLLPILPEPTHARNILRMMLTTEIVALLSREASEHIDKSIWGTELTAPRTNDLRNDDQPEPARALQSIERDELSTLLDHFRSAVARVSEGGPLDKPNIGDLAGRIAASGACEEALEIAQNCKNGKARIQIVTAMADRLPPNLLLTALNTIRYAEGDDQVQQELMLTLLRKLAAVGKAKLAISETTTLGPRRHADFLIGIADSLDRAAIFLAINRILGPHEWHHPSEAGHHEQKLRALQGLAPRLSMLVGPEVAIAKLEQWPVPIERSLLVLSLVSSVPADIRTRLVAESIQVVKDPEVLKVDIMQQRTGQRHITEVFELAVPWMTSSQLGEALDVTFTLEAPQPRAIALSKLAPRLSTSVLSETLSRVSEISDGASRIECLVSLIPHLREALFEEALEMVLRTGNADERRKEGERRERMLGHLLWRLEQLKRAREKGLVAIAKVAPRNALERLLRAVWDIGDELAVDEMQREIRRAIGGGGRTGGNPSCLTLPASQEGPKQPHIIVQISDEEAATALAAALAALTRDASEWYRRYGARVSFDLAERTKALADLAPKLSTAQLAEAVEAVGGVQHDELVAGSLAVLAPFLPADLLERAFDISSGIPTAHYRSRALKAFLPRMAELGEPGRALAVVRGLDGPSSELNRSDIIARLARHLPQHLLTEALDLIRAMPSDEGRRKAIAALDHRLPELPADELWEAWASTVTVAVGRGRGQLLSDLAAIPDTLQALGGRGIQAELSQAIDDVARWWP
jgi:hypothetical protein